MARTKNKRKPTEDAEERLERRSAQTETGHFYDVHGNIIPNQCRYYELSENRDGKKRLIRKGRAEYVAELDVLQVRDPATEPVQCSLVHAFNNAVGIRGLISAADMISARRDLVEVAGALSVKAYFGTDESGPGDWPVEVLTAVLADQFGYINLKRCGYDVKTGDVSPDRIFMAVIGYARMGFQLLCEQQLPVTTEAKDVDKNAPGDELWDDLPVSPAGERTHFIAVRNGLVYDPLRGPDARPVPVSEYPHWALCKRMYKLIIP